MATDYRMIVSKAQTNEGETLVIGAAGGADNNVYIQLLAKEEDPQFDLQTWERRPTRDGKGYLLINKAKGTCLARANHNNGSPLILVGTNQIETNDFLVWRDDTVPGTYNAINSYVDWEQKITIPGNGPYTPGQQLITWEWSGAASKELWRQVPYLKSVELMAIDFDIDAGEILDRAPMVVSSQTITNETSVEQQQSVTLTYTTNHRYNFKREKGLKISESVEFKASLPMIAESKVKIGVEGTWKYTEENETTTQQQFEVHVPVTIPPHSSVQVSAVLLSGELDVPYAATFKLTYWNDEVEEEMSFGRFIGVNSYNVVTRYDPLGETAKEIERHPVAALVAAAA